MCGGGINVVFDALTTALPIPQHTRQAGRQDMGRGRQANMHTGGGLWGQAKAVS